mmetsp:Transcript_10264/g.22888  ORF Transcript_10264/g.22888 Transcript_10264/m.22888 type:complete len:198 (+) Transcript_10264:192-785(+)
MAADSNAPPADLFNIWRQDYMVSPAAAAKDEAQRKANTFFDGVLPPFSNVGNMERGSVPDTPRLRGIGIAADFSTANPTSAYDTAKFGTVYLPNQDVVTGETGVSPQAAVAARVKAGIKNVQRVNSLNPYAKENKEGNNGRDFSALGIPLSEAMKEGTAAAPAAKGRAAAPAKGTVRAASAGPSFSLPSFPNPFAKK